MISLLYFSMLVSNSIKEGRVDRIDGDALLADTASVYLKERAGEKRDEGESFWRIY